MLSTVAVPLQAPIAFGADDSLVDTSFPGTLAHGGSIRAPLDAIAGSASTRHPRGVVDLMADPLVVTQAHDLADGYRNADGTQVASDAAPAQEAARFLGILSEVTADAEERRDGGLPLRQPDPAGHGPQVRRRHLARDPADRPTRRRQRRPREPASEPAAQAQSIHHPPGGWAARRRDPGLAGRDLDGDRARRRRHGRSVGVAGVARAGADGPDRRGADPGASRSEHPSVVRSHRPARRSGPRLAAGARGARTDLETSNRCP